MPARLPQETRERFVRMYVEDDMSMQKIAEATGHCVNVVRDALIAVGIKPRRRGGIPNRNNSRLPDGVYAEAVRLYVDEFKSLKEVAAALAISESTVKRAVVTAGHRLRPRVWGNRNKHLPQADVRAAVEALTRYPTSREAWEALGLTEGQFYHRLRIAGVEPPGRRRIKGGEIRAVRRLRREGLNKVQIAEQLGMSYHRVRRVLDKH